MPKELIAKIPILHHTKKGTRVVQPGEVFVHADDDAADSLISGGEADIATKEAKAAIAERKEAEAKLQAAAAKEAEVRSDSSATATEAAESKK
jgi:hypothetical protein